MKEKMSKLFTAIKSNPIVSGFFAMLTILFVMMLIQIMVIVKLVDVEETIFTSAMMALTDQQTRPVRICDENENCLKLMTLRTYGASTPPLLPVGSVSWSGK